MRICDRGLSCSRKVRRQIAVPIIILIPIIQMRLLFNRMLASLTRFPILTHLLHALSIVEFRIVIFVQVLNMAFPEREMLGVNSDAVIVLRTTCANECPAAFLFFEIETSGVGKKEDCDQRSC